MNRNYRYQFYVEGECEKKLIEEFKKQQTMIVSGRVNVFNAIQNTLPNALLANLSSNTIVVLVFDTDTADISVLRANIQKMKRFRNVIAVWCIMQVKNLEDELLRSTDVKEIKDLLNCKTDSDFKRDFLREKNIMIKLSRHRFDYNKFWSSKPDGAYSGFENCGYKVKKPQ